MEKIIDGKVYTFVPSGVTEGNKCDGCCGLLNPLCLLFGDECMSDLSKIWKLKQDDKHE